MTVQTTRRFSDRVIALTATVIALLTMACGGEKSAEPPEPGPSPSKLAFIWQPTTATAGIPLSPAIQVQVQSSTGHVITSATTAVTLSITSGVGTANAVLSGTLTRTAAAGVATFNDVVLDRSGTAYTLTATAPNLAPATSTSFNTQLSVRIQEGSNQTGITGHLLADSVAVIVEDPVGMAKTAVPVDWSATGGTLSAASGVTDASGVAKVAWRVATGSQSLTAIASGVNAATQATGLSAASCSFIGTGDNPGFPVRDTLRFLPVERKVRIAALFVDFPDYPAARSITEIMDDIVSRGVARLRATTYDKLQFEVVPSAQWVRMPENAADFSWNDFLTHRTYIDSVLSRVDAAGFDFSDIDLVWIFRSSPDDPVVRGGVMTLRKDDFYALPPRDGQQLHRFIAFGSDAYYTYPQWSDYGATIIAHETGHSFGLPDLYAYTSTDAVDGLRFTGGWSFMGWVAPATTWFAAERFYLGVLPDDDVLCPPAQPFGAVVTLQPLNATDGLRGIGLRTGASSLTFLEVRRDEGLDAGSCSSGLLAYEVNGAIPTGEGPIVVHEARASPAGPERDLCGPKWLAPYQVNGALNLGNPDIRVRVLSTAPDGSTTVRVERR